MSDIPNPQPDAKRHRRAGGRERRDPNAKQHGPAYITRAIPPYDIMGEENLQRIEHAADRIMAETGIDIRDDDEALALFRKAGAKVDGMRVRFEPGHLREILKTAPAEFTQHARNPARSVLIGGDSVVFSPAYGSPFVMDLDKGRRYGTIEDFRNFIKLAYASLVAQRNGRRIPLGFGHVVRSPCPGLGGRIKDIARARQTAWAIPAAAH